MSPITKTALFSAAVLAPAQVLADTVLGVTVFSRHGDRTTKHYSGYSLTNLGFQQNYQTGALFRDTYLASGSSKQILGISEDKYVASQIYASAPDQKVLLNTATAFLQGLYPPLSDIEGADDSLSTQTLNNGTEYSAPLSGYQYVVLHGENDNSPDTIWIKGDDSCPVAATAQESYLNSTEYAATYDATTDFYAGFADQLSGVYDYTPADMTYENAYDIFDLINVASIHNESFPAVSAAELYQLRILADRWEAGHNMNISHPDERSMGGKTLAGALMTQLNETVTGSGKLKFSLLAGSYDTFMAFFSITGLTEVSTDFYGLPGYASTMALELFTAEDNATAFPKDVADLQVRFLFRNGSDAGAPLTAFPLFGKGQQSLPWTTFVEEMSSRAVTDVGDWCTACSSKEEFCVALTADSDSSEDGSAAATTSSGGMSNAVAGVIGAMVTLGVVAIAGLGFFLIRRKKTAATPAPASASVASHDAAEKGSFSTQGNQS